MLGVLGLTDTTPFFTGTVPGGAAPIPLTVSLGGRQYPIDLRQYRHSSQETLRDGAVVSSEPNDSLFNANGAWSRYRYTWHFGEGQVNADFRKDSTEFRYRTSVGVDPWTQGEISLLHDTSLIRTLTSGTNVVQVSNTRLYVSDGTALAYTTDLVNFTACTAPGGTIQSMCTDGTDLYVATSTNLVKYLSATPGTPTAFTTPVTGNCTLIAFCANRLLLGRDNVLYEVGASALGATLRTHYQSAFRWNTAFNVGSRIYIGGFSGSRSEIYTVTTDNSGVLIQAQEAAPLPLGELIRSGASHSGVVLLCTSLGVRQAQVGGDGTLTYGPLITEVGDVQAVTFEGRFAWVGWTNHPSTGRGVARIALDQAVDVLQPAYASDVYETVNTGGNVVGVARLLNRTVFAVSGVGLYAESDTTYLTEGSISSGEMYFGTVETKALTELQVVCEPLGVGQSILGYAYDERATLLGSATLNELSADELRLDLNASQVRNAEVQVLLRGPGTSTPVVKFWRLRAYPVPPSVLQWLVPLLIHTRTVVGLGNGQELTFDVFEEADQIRTWYDTRESIIYQEGEHAYRVRVDAFELQPSNWTDDGAFFQHTMIVRLVSA